MRKILGYSLIASPFILITVAMGIDMGWFAALALWVAVFSMLGIFALGAWLING